MEDKNNKTNITRDEFRESFRKIILGITIALILFFVLVLLPTFGDTSGKYVGLGMILLPFMPLMYVGLVFYPIYFMILALRYSRERGNMHLLDKIMFYILAIPLISLGALAIYKVYSGNLIQKAFTNNHSDVKQVVKKQTGPVDLVLKDIYFDNSWLIVMLCNDSSVVSEEGVTIKIETDKNTNLTLENFPVPQPSKCDESFTSIDSLGLIEGDIVKITATIDPENKISDTNKGNNKMTKNINSGNGS